MFELVVASIFIGCIPVYLCRNNNGWDSAVVLIKHGWISMFTADKYLRYKSTDEYLRYKGTDKYLRYKRPEKLPRY
jgi:hypothetical protein